MAIPTPIPVTATTNPASTTASDAITSAAKKQTAAIRSPAITPKIPTPTGITTGHTINAISTISAIFTSLSFLPCDASYLYQFVVPALRCLIRVLSCLSTLVGITFSLRHLFLRCPLLLISILCKLTVISRML